MKTNRKRIKNRTGIRSFLILLAMVMATGLWVNRADPLVLTRFLGDIDPFLAFLLSGILGMACLGFLDRNFGLTSFKIPTLKSSLMPAAGAFVFGAIVITIDLIMPMPENLNVTFPVSVLFYPAIGFVAEITFHVLPFTLLATILHWARPGIKKECVIRASLFISALAEPLYQVLSMHHTGQYRDLTLIIVGIHILCLSLYQLFVFTRHGFYHMYLFRLVYYMIWHVAWGYFRLQII